MSTQAQPAQDGQKVMTISERQKDVKGLLQKYAASIREALPSHLTPDKMIRVALTAMTKTPKLYQCTSSSLISAVVTLSQLGLLPDGVLGEAYLIPFKNNTQQTMECQVVIGYRGLCALAMRSGQLLGIQARAVYQGDDFNFKFGLNEELDHVPCGVKDNDKITHFYAVVKLKGGGHVFDVMTRAEVEAIRDESKNYKYAKDKQDTIWHTYFDQMGCKTVLRRLMKLVPLSPEIQKAVGLDEIADLKRQNLGGEILGMPETDDQMTEEIDYELMEDEREQEQGAIEQARTEAFNKSEKAQGDLAQILASKNKRASDDTKERGETK